MKQSISNQPIISIIVPVYNVEKYLLRCLYSLLDIQFLYEIIIVIDGSKDNCFDIAKSFQDRFYDKNIILVNQSNKGVSIARNTGLSIAKGKYVTFIDPDDFIDPLNFSRLIEKTILDELDIGIGEFVLWKEHSDPELRTTEKYYLDKGVTLGISLLNVLRPNIWNNIYKKDFLDRYKIMFVPEMTSHEDDVFYLHSMMLAKRVKNYNIPFYFYLIRSDGAMSKNNNSGYRYHCRYLLAQETFKLKNLPDSQEMFDFVCERSGWLLMTSLEYMAKHNIDLFMEKEIECREMLEICQNIERIPLEQRQMMKSLLQNWNGKIFI